MSLNLGSWSNGSNLIDLQALITHEFGHTLGLTHSDKVKSIMYSNPYHSYEYQLILREDDISAVQHLYPYEKPKEPSEVDFSPIERDTNHIVYYLLEIGKPMTIDVSVDYFTEYDTAIAGQDYIPASGIATIIAGNTHTTIGVEIIGDTISESDEIFKLIITNPQGAKFPEGINEISANKIFVITNNSSHQIKDIEITCTHYAKSGTKIDSNTRTIYDNVSAKSTKSFEKINMGFIHSQAEKTGYKIVDLKI